MTVTLPNGESRTLPVSIVGFELVPDLPVKVKLVSPKTAVTSATPTFTWNAVADAAYYVLRITQAAGAPVDLWYRPEQVGCQAEYGPCRAVPATALRRGV